MTKPEDVEDGDVEEDSQSTEQEATATIFSDIVENATNSLVLGENNAADQARAMQESMSMQVSLVTIITSQCSVK